MNNEFLNASHDNNIGYGNQPSTISQTQRGITQPWEILTCSTILLRIPR